jgi:hypothetical protein
MTVRDALGCLSLLADRPPPRFSDVFWPSLPWFIALALVLLIGGAVLAFLDRWRKSSSAPQREDVSIAGFLRECREQRDRGEITAEEYERILARLTGKPVAPRAAPPAPPASQPPASPEGPAVASD